MGEIAKLTKSFEGTEVTTYFCRGRACWIAKDIGMLMGYSDEGGRLSKNIGYDWRDEFIEGTDYVVIAGEELVEFKKILEASTQQGLTYASHLMLLFESGFHLSVMKSHKPSGVRLRRFIADEVLPQVFRDGSFLPERKVEKGRIVESMESVELRKLRLAEAREARLDRQFKSKVLSSLMPKIRKSGRIAEDIIEAYEVCAVELGSGLELSVLKPKQKEPDWKSPTEIAEMYGMSAQMIGRVITPLDLRGNKEGLCRAIVNKAAGSERTVTTYLYSPEAVEMIRLELERRGLIGADGEPGGEGGGIAN